MTSQPKSLLDVVKTSDNAPYDVAIAESHRRGFRLVAPDGETEIGMVALSAVTKLKYTEEQHFRLEFISIDETEGRVAFKPSTIEERDTEIAKVLELWRNKQLFDLDKAWRSELYTVYCPSHVPFLHIERSACSLFGIVTYGVHVNAYVGDSAGRPKGIWIAKRASTKQTYPGYLDNTVGGGMGHSQTVEETLLSECQQEAGFDAQFVKSRAKAVGAVSYKHQVESDAVYHEPEVEYVYDMEVPSTVEPRPADGEVEWFRLMGIEEVKKELLAGLFVYNSGLIVVDFLVRHGLVTANQPDYLEIIQRCHRKHNYPLR